MVDSCSGGSFQGIGIEKISLMKNFVKAVNQVEAAFTN